MKDNERLAPLPPSQNVLDKKMNGPYNVVVGESFTMDIAHVRSSLLYMYFGGYLAVLVWKCV